MRSLFLVLAFCLAGTAAFAQADGLGQALERDPAPAAASNIEETLRALGLTGTWAIDCTKPAGAGNVRAEFRTLNGKITQVQDIGGSVTNNYEFQKVERIASDRIRITARFYNSQAEEVNVFEWLLQGNRIRTISNMSEKRGPFVVDGVIVAVKRETPWLTKCS